MMRDYSQIVTKIISTPWLILPESLQVILDIVDRRLDGENLTKNEIRARIGRHMDEPSYSGSYVSGSVGILPLQGPIFPKANLMTEMSGATSLAQFRQDFAAMMSDPRVGSIVLDIDSPGGMSDLVLEAGREIRAAREVKSIYAVANTLAASAAYWLASQATEVFVTPSGMVGSIGVYTVHEDRSRKEANDGIKTTLIYSGRYKTEGNPYEPLTQAGHDHRQYLVNSLYEEFLQEVANGRGTDADTVETEYGSGRLVLPHDAEVAGMVDGVATLEQVVGNILSQPHNTTGATGATVALRMQQESDTVGQEHSDPGTGTPPEPRKQDRGGTDNKDRLESPPEVLPRPVTGTEANVNELLVALAESLGIEMHSDMDDAKLSSLIQEKVFSMNAELEPLRAAALEADKTKSFREQYPDEYERMSKLEERDRAHAAKQFATRYERFTVTDESGAEVKQTRGFSALVLSKIEDAHRGISERTFTHDDLSSMLDSVPNGIVEFGERGSARTLEDDGTTSLIGQPAKNRFAAKVQEIMEQDDLDYGDAVKLAAKNHPDIYREYRESLPKSRKEA